ncbi:MAG: hypothetical protein QF815_01005 [Candidatus Peribacteraceae bacterium]|nr:hypothetical protein [Candidatus Peribacteraceae bacterium]MDP7476960.1 hypothetical protein [Candidatus Peribacteraceae bacterium]
MRILANSLMALGAATTAVGSQKGLGAQLSNQGTNLVQRYANEPMLMGREAVMPAAMEQGNGFGIIAFGMLMMLLGFGLHSLIVLRNQEVERTVPVKQKKKSPRSSRRQMEVIWIERTIRF